MPAKKIKTVEDLIALPVGTKITFKGKHLVFQYQKNGDGVWEGWDHNLRVTMSHYSEDIAAKIRRVALTGYASAG